MRTVRMVHVSTVPCRVAVESCEQVQHTTSRELLEPLREFTMSRRDPRYDALYQQSVSTPLIFIS